MLHTKKAKQKQKQKNQTDVKQAHANSHGVILTRLHMVGQRQQRQQKDSLIDKQLKEAEHK